MSTTFATVASSCLEPETGTGGNSTSASQETSLDSSDVLLAATGRSSSSWSLVKRSSPAWLLQLLLLLSSSVSAAAGMRSTGTAATGFIALSPSSRWSGKERGKYVEAGCSTTQTHRLRDRNTQEGHTQARPQTFSPAAEDDEETSKGVCCGRRALSDSTISFLPLSRDCLGVKTESLLRSEEEILDDAIFFVSFPNGIVEPSPSSLCRVISGSGGSVSCCIFPPWRRTEWEGSLKLIVESSNTLADEASSSSVTVSVSLFFFFCFLVRSFFTLFSMIFSPRDSSWAPVFV
eukprot:284817927_3